MGFLLQMVTSLYVAIVDAKSDTPVILAYEENNPFSETQSFVA